MGRRGIDTVRGGDGRDSRLGSVFLVRFLAWEVRGRATEGRHTKHEPSDLDE